MKGAASEQWASEEVGGFECDFASLTGFRGLGA